MAKIKITTLGFTRSGKTFFLACLKNYLEMIGRIDVSVDTDIFSSETNFNLQKTLSSFDSSILLDKFPKETHQFKGEFAINIKLSINKNNKNSDPITHTIQIGEFSGETIEALIKPIQEKNSDISNNNEEKNSDISNNNENSEEIFKSYSKYFADTDILMFFVSSFVKDKKFLNDKEFQALDKARKRRVIAQDFANFFTTIQNRESNGFQTLSNLKKVFYVITDDLDFNLSENNGEGVTLFSYFRNNPKNADLIFDFFNLTVDTQDEADYFTFKYSDIFGNRNIIDIYNYDQDFTKIENNQWQDIFYEILSILKDLDNQ